jgi:xanthine dehydrogenase YagR molybdenum-binding subunit
MAKDGDQRNRPGLSRRRFLQGTGLSIAAGGLLEAGSEALAASTGKAKVLGPGAVSLSINVNGTPRKVEVMPSTTLADALRTQLGLTGTKIVCDRGSCSACTVHLDGTPVCSCMTLALDVGTRNVTTIEGLAHGAKLHPIQEQFIAHDAMQCGFCTPGMLMSCAGLLARNPKPTLDEVKQAISGNICRCGTYPKVIAATLAASGAPLPKWAQVRVIANALVQNSKAVSPPAGDPPRWPANENLSVVGKPMPRIDGQAKVTGTARYTADIQLPGMLYARRLASSQAHARVKSVDTTAAEKLPGVKTVHVLEHNREGAVLRNPAATPDKYPIVRYAGQTIGAVAAISQAIADEAARLVRVDYEPLPFSVDLDEAQKDDAPLVYPGPTDMAGSAGGGGAMKGLPQKGNVRGPNEQSHGDLGAGFRAAEIVIEGDFRTQVQTHSALETHGVVADWKPDGLTVYASTQGTATVRDELAEVFELPKSKVRVITEFMGGGFGAKFGAGSHGVLAAHLSKAAGAPVRLMLDRKEEHTSVGNRPATHQHLRIGAKKDGTLTAVDLTSWGTAGVGLGAGVGPWTGLLYPAPNFHSAQFDVFTNAGPGSAFRAPGAPQAMFALEQLIDELAERVGIDPLLLREKLDAGDERAEREARRVERLVGAERIGWTRRHAPGADPGPIKRGLGVAQAQWGRFVDLNSSCEVRMNRDGSIEFLSSVQDIGTGTRTAVAQIVAEELGVRPEDVTMRIGDTANPIGPSSGGSKTLLAMTAPARTAAWQVKRKLLEVVAPAIGADMNDLEMRDGRVTSRSRPSQFMSLKQAAAKLPTEHASAQATRTIDYGGDKKDGYGGVQFAEVAVDTQTGVIHVERMVAVHDCGRPVNPLALQSQVNGGILHGLSWALYEHRQLDAATGHMVNPNLDQYKIAGVREAPEIEVTLLEQYQGRTATDTNGIGEPANIATAAAIANAFYNATGVRMRRLPMKPAVVLAALEKGGA